MHTHTHTYTQKTIRESTPSNDNGKMWQTAHQLTKQMCKAKHFCIPSFIFMPHRDSAQSSVKSSGFASRI